MMPAVISAPWNLRAVSLDINEKQERCSGHPHGRARKIPRAMPPTRRVLHRAHGHEFTVGKANAFDL